MDSFYASPFFGASFCSEKPLPFFLGSKYLPIFALPFKPEDFFWNWIPSVLCCCRLCFSYSCCWLLSACLAASPGTRVVRNTGKPPNLVTTDRIRLRRRVPAVARSYRPSSPGGSIAFLSPSASFASRAFLTNWPVCLHLVGLSFSLSFWLFRL